MSAATVKAPRARKPKAEPPVTAAGARRDLIKLLQANADSVQLWTVWSDFVEMSAIAISNAVDLPQRDPREARYLEVIKRYKPEQLDRFAQALGALTLSLEEEPGDVLGSVFMELELGNKWKGQFFTPFSLCRLMSALQVDDDLRAKVASQGYVTANDPAVGGGAMLIALAVEMAEAGLPYQQHLHVTAQDIDERAAHMAYVQLSLLGVPGVVVVGDTLRMECRAVWYTPAHILGGWARRLRAGDVLGRLPELVAAAAQLEAPVNAEADQPAAVPAPPPASVPTTPGQTSMPWAAQPARPRRRAA